MSRQLYVDQTRISHIVTKMWFEDKKLKGIVESANTNVGRDFQGLIRQGSSVAFSMRGVGPISEKKGEYIEVKQPLSIFTYDWVIHPSHSVAYMEKIMTESTINMLVGKDQKLNHSLSESNKLLNEGFIIPVEKEEAIRYIKESSRNYKNIKNQLEVEDDAEVTINESANLINIRQNNEIIKIFLEDYISQEINNYFLRKF
jgi:hypothetical protein